MLRYFRINDPYRLLGLLALLIVIYLPVIIDSPGITFPELKSVLVGEKIAEGNVPYTGIIDSTAPITAWLYGFIDLFFGRSLWPRHVLAVLILFTQSTYLGLVFNNKKAFSENTYIPSLIFSILAFFSFDMLSLSGELFGSGFLLLALNNLFKEIQFRTQRDEPIFNLGVYLGLATLCSFSYLIHLLCVGAILAVYTRSSLRTFMLLIFGFLLPQLLIMGLYYLNNSLTNLWEFYYLPNLSLVSEKFIDASGLLVLGAIPLFYLLISLVMLNRESRFTKYQSQLLQCMFFWMVFSVFQAFYTKELRPQSFIALIPSLSYFITHLLLIIRRRKYAEMHTWILFLGIISVSYLALYAKMDSVNYNSLLVAKTSAPTITNKSILVLENDLPLYVHNKPATPFLNWNLSRNIFEQPDYYENTIAVYEGLSSDLPEIIIDPHDLIKKFFDRIPELKKKYKRVGNDRYERVP